MQLRNGKVTNHKALVRDQKLANWFINYQKKMEKIEIMLSRIENNAERVIECYRLQNEYFYTINRYLDDLVENKSWRADKINSILQTLILSDRKLQSILQIKGKFEYILWKLELIHRRNYADHTFERYTYEDAVFILNTINYILTTLKRIEMYLEQGKIYR